MSLGEGTALLFIWTAIVLFCALLFLGSGFLQAALIATFVLVSCALGLGGRRLLQGSFAIALLAIAVSLGFPHPSEWKGMTKTAWSEISSTFVAAR